MKTIAALVFLSLVGAAPARAADTLVTTVAKPTAVDVYNGAAVWSTWDPAARVYRLTAYSGGTTRTLAVAPNKVPFDVDLGPGPNNGHVAVYSRCKRPPVSTFALNGRRGCDLYIYRFTTGREKKLTRASDPNADEYWPTAWRGRLAFTRTDRAGHQVLYWRSLTGKGRTHRLRTGAPSPEGPSVDEELDMRGRRVAFARHDEFGGSLRLSMTGGRGRVLVRIPGSGAASTELDAQGPTIAGHSVRWGLVVAGTPSFTEIRRVSIATRKELRATTRIDAGGAQFTATTGFGYVDGTVWYVKPVAAGAFEIHQVNALKYEPAPLPAIR